MWHLVAAKIGGSRSKRPLTALRLVFISTCLSSPPRELKLVNPLRLAALGLHSEEIGHDLRKSSSAGCRGIVECTVVPALAHDDEDTVIILTIGSTTNCLTRTNVPRRRFLQSCVSTVPIIVPFGHSWRGSRISSAPQYYYHSRPRLLWLWAIGVINSVAGLGSLAPQSREPFAILTLRLSYKEKIGMSRNMSDDR